MVLSWREALADSRAINGRNLVLHEFAHQLDLLETAGRPVYGAPEQRVVQARRTAVFLDAFDTFCEQVDSGRRVKGLDEYGAEDESEFFAVATESFFERGAFLKEHHPQLYHVLSEYYNQDPATWAAPRLRPEDAAGTGRQQRRRRREEARRRQKHKK